MLTLAATGWESTPHVLGCLDEEDTSDVSVHKMVHFITSLEARPPFNPPDPPLWRRVWVWRRVLVRDYLITSQQYRTEPKSK